MAAAWGLFVRGKRRFHVGPVFRVLAYAVSPELALTNHAMNIAYRRGLVKRENKKFLNFFKISLKFLLNFRFFLFSLLPSRK